MENFLLQRELTISCSRTERGKHMQLGIRLHDIKKAPLEERLAIAKEQGFLCGHLALSKVITEYPVDDGALTPGYAMYLKKIFAKNDLDIAVLGCYLNLANPDEGQLAKITHRYLAHIRFASLLGVGVVGTETGAVNEAYKFEEKNHSDEALDIFIQNVKPVISYAEKMSPLGNASALDCANYIVVMFSDLTKMVTMQNLFHDGGFSFTGVTQAVIEQMEK